MFKPIAIGTAKIRRPGTGAGIGDGAAMGIAKFFIQKSQTAFVSRLAIGQNWPHDQTLLLDHPMLEMELL